MPNGKTHIIWWKRVFPFSIIVSLILMLFSPIFAIMFLIGYAVGEPLFSADLDQIGLTSTDGRWMRNFGCLGVLFVMYFVPYAYMLPHRSFLSHFPVVSDLVRLAYILIIPSILWLYFQLPINNMVLLGLAGMLSGLSLSTLVHYLLDM